MWPFTTAKIWVIQSEHSQSQGNKLKKAKIKTLNNLTISSREKAVLPSSPIARSVPKPVLNVEIQAQAHDSLSHAGVTPHFSSDS